MFTLLKKNKKKIITIFLFIFIIFISLNKNFEKNFKKVEISENSEKTEFDRDNFNIFFLNYKNYNEIISLENSLEKGILPRVAHAGGGFKEKIYTNFKTEVFNSRWERFYLELDNTNHNTKINEVMLNFKNKYQFSDTDVLFSKKNCFYIK